MDAPPSAAAPPRSSSLGKRTGRACSPAWLRASIFAFAYCNSSSSGDSQFVSGVLRLGSMWATTPIAQSMEEHNGTFDSTYGWHPRSLAAVIATCAT